MATMNTNQELVEAYVQMITNRIEAGWDPYLLSFMFNQIGGSPRWIGRVQEREVERVYATLLLRIFRKPRSEPLLRLPLWFGCPVFPVPKHERKALRDVAVNDGQHIQSVVLMPPGARLKGSLADHIEEDQARYTRDPLFRIHAVEITHDADYVAGYVLKSLERGRVGPDDMIVLPRLARETTRDGISPWTNRRLAETEDRIRGIG